MVGRYIVPAALRTVFAESTNATEAIMDRRTQTVCRWPLLLAGLLLVLGGCANLRLPAIDPSGRRIFLPTPSHTTINTPGQSGALPTGRFSCLPRPAYQSPPQPPLCPPGVVLPSSEIPCPPAAVAAQPCPPATPPCPPTCPPAVTAPVQGTCAGKTALVITPARQVAPVGSEVVLMASVCGAAGAYQPNQPVEWSLSQDSVGTLVDVDDLGVTACNRMLRQQPKKLAGDFVVGRTASFPHRITRGTPSPEDDVALQRGQTWVSLTSSSEGTSRVTVLAPKVETWQERQQTVLVHWVDASFTLPAPAIAPAGRPHVLTTTVNRQTTGGPVEGWIVRYQIHNAETGQNAAGDGAVSEIRTDSQGKASVRVSPEDAKPGLTRVHVQVIRPAGDSDEIPRMVVGQGWTSVTWSAPGLSVVTSGPATGERGAALAYQVQVANPGDRPAEQVQLAVRLPSGMRMIDSMPSGEVFGDRVQWSLGTLDARGSQIVRLNVEARQKGQMRLCAVASGAGDLRAEHCATTNVRVQPIRLEVTGPETVEVGQQAVYRISVTNVDDAPLTGVVVRDTPDAGLNVAGGGSVIEKPLGTLAVGESRSFALEFTVGAAGKLCHQLEVAADGGHRATARACLTANAPAPQPAMHVTKTGPTQRSVGDLAQFALRVSNTGQTPLTGLRIVDQYDRGLTPKQASHGVVERPGELIWSLPALQPGQSIDLQVVCQCDAPGPRVCNRVTVTCAQNVTRADEACVEILARQAPALAGPQLPTEPAPRSEDLLERPTTPTVRGELKLELSDLSDPVVVNSQVTYLLIVRNAREEADRNINVTFEVPQGMELVNVIGPVDQVGGAGAVRQLQPIAELRPGEAVSFRIVLRPSRTGQYTFRAQAGSLRALEPVAVQETTRVNAQ